MSWLSEIVERSYTLSGEDEPYWQAKRMARVIREWAASGPLLRNIYTSMLMSEGRNKGLPPQVQYWLQEIPKFLDNLSNFP